MSDTRRELSALQTLEADNSSGAITPQVMRDNLVSAHGSNVIQGGAYASFPSTPITGDLFYTETMVWRYSGSVWIPFGPIFQLTDPTLQTWSWLNQGSATIVTANGGICLSSPSNGVAYNWRARMLAAITPPYTVIVCSLIATQIIGAAGAVSPILLYDGTKLTSFGMFAGIGCAPELDDWTSVSAYSANLKSTGYPYDVVGPLSPIWWKFVDDGTNHNWYVGADGVNWNLFYSRARGAFLSASGQQVGFGVQPYGEVQTQTILSWSS